VHAYERARKGKEREGGREGERERKKERESDGLEGIEGRISSKAAANTEILLPRPGIVLVCTILQR